MEITLRINNIEKTVTFEQHENQYTFVIDDRKYVVSDVSMAGGVLNFFVGTKTYHAAVSKNVLGTQITLGGRDYFLEEADEGGGGSRGVHHHGNGSIEAPMPGNIIAVNVERGDSVEPGDSLVVLESMKMQNEITSPVMGEVRAVNCSKGDQVGFGEVLVEITVL